MDLQSPRFGCSGPSGQIRPATRRPSNFVTYQVTPWGIGYKTNPPELTKKVSPYKSPDFSAVGQIGLGRLTHPLGCSDHGLFSDGAKVGGERGRVAGYRPSPPGV